MNATTNTIPTVSSYDDYQSLPAGTTVKVSESLQIANGDKYALFTVVDDDGYENYLEPVRPGIVAEYVQNGLGYLIQKVNGGYRFIGVEAGEDDDFGSIMATKHAALVVAREDWLSYGTAGDDWSDWSRQLAHDVAVPEIDLPENDAVKDRVLEVLSDHTATAALFLEERESFAAALIQAFRG